MGHTRYSQFSLSLSVSLSLSLFFSTTPPPTTPTHPYYPPLLLLLLSLSPSLSIYIERERGRERRYREREKERSKTRLSATPGHRTLQEGLTRVCCHKERPFCFTSTEARWLIRDVDRVGRGRKSEGSTADTARKRPERPWTAARTTEVLRRCPLAIAQRLVHCAAIAVSTAVLGAESQRQCPSVAPLLRNNLKRKKSNFRSAAPPPCSWSLQGWGSSSTSLSWSRLEH